LTQWMAVVIATVILLLLFLCRRREAEHTPSDSLVVITGCDSGFGEMAVKRLSSEGYKVIACCLTEDGVNRYTYCALQHYIRCRLKHICPFRP
jgi:D-arabinose 1-dehydrogenase-like Zn-dependent alcohol dehydrogenase